MTETPPALAGATATNQYKEATLETGLKVNVPPFIKPARRSGSTPGPANISSASSNGSPLSVSGQLINVLRLSARNVNALTAPERPWMT